MQSRVFTWVLMWLGIVWSAQVFAANPVAPTPGDEPSAELKVANRSVMVFRASLLGETPELRARRARLAITEALDSGDELTVTLDMIQDGYLVLLGGRRAFFVTPGDVDAIEHSSVLQAAQGAADKLRQVVDETREARSLHQISLSLAACAVATALYMALLWGMGYLRRKLLNRLPALMLRHAHSLNGG